MTTPPSAAAAVDAALVRRDYLDGLNATTPRRAEELRPALTGHVERLADEVRALLPQMGEARRGQAEHCLTRAAETLDGRETVRDAVAHTYALAVSARALLALYRRPRPELDDQR
jgi:hypothetical protein